MKYRSEFKHVFTNRGCLHCAILNVSSGFKKKVSRRQEIYNFSFKMLKMRISRF